MTSSRERPGWRRLDGVDWSMVIFVALVCMAATGIRGSGRNLDYWANFTVFVGRFLPPDWSVLPDVGWAMLETARIALVATAVAAVASLPLALAASRTVSPWWIAIPARLLLNAVRSVPALVWAVLAVAITGPNALAGCLALSGYSAGYLAKFFSESIDATDQWPARSLRAMDANAIQAFRWGTWPQLRTQLASHGLWMLEYNLRSAAIVGYVGAGGVGLLLQTYQEYGDWDRFGVVLIAILVLVTIIDWAGQRVRQLWNPSQHIPAGG
ncbi:MAG: phosphonate ABC transporter, permease protein PhnE [Caulobacterales bacterium]|nr:phosphonate ABC transporter, permease protein PhnE [Caulobacterales bacterium]